MVYKGTGPEKGTVVESADAYDYALERCLHGSEEDGQEFREMLVEWFYSGNWTEEDGYGQDYSQ